MRIGRVILALCGMVFTPLLARAQAPVPAANQVAAVRVEEVSLASVQPEKLTFNTKLGLFPEKSITVKSLSFSAMTINGVPVYVSPLSGKFVMKKGEFLKLPDVQIVVYTRDLATLQPVRSVIDQGKVVVAGEVIAVVDGNLLEDLALRSLHPRVVMPFNKEIPVLIPGGDAGRTAALATLDVLEKAGPAAKLLGAFFPGQDAAWRSDLMRNQVKHVVLVRTSCTVVDGQNSYPLDFVQLGFWIGPSTVMVPEEAVKPWEFDAEAQSMLSARHAHVDKASITMSVQPVVPLDGAAADTGGAPAGAWTLAAGDFTIATEGNPPGSRVAYSPTSKAIEVRERASANNYALLRFKDGVTGDPVVSAPPAENGWDRLAVFRLVRNSAGDSVQTEVIFVPGTTNGQQIQFGQPIDDTGFGSPVFTQDGVIAMAQDETHATFLNSIKHLDEKAK